MGSVLVQSMTKSSEDINCRQALKPLLPPQQQLMLPLPTSYVQSEQLQCAHFNEQQNPVAQKENATDAIVPFDPNLEDQEVHSFDINRILNDVVAETNQIANPSNVIANQNNLNVMNNVPKLFTNCQIGNITFNFNK